MLQIAMQIIGSTLNGNIFMIIMNRTDDDCSKQGVGDNLHKSVLHGKAAGNDVSVKVVNASVINIATDVESGREGMVVYLCFNIYWKSKGVAYTHGYIKY
jgi:hypothetical protein